MTGVKFYRDGKYVSAFQSNAHHLNFYIRKPATKRWGSLSKQAQANFDVKREKREEIQLHVREKKVAEKLAAWLFELA